MTLLLTSVRNLAEAEVAASWGSDWLDLKEPNDGALGAVPDDEIRRVIAWAKQQACATPISATIGDCWWQPDVIPERVERVNSFGVDYIKIGLFVDSLDMAARRSLEKASVTNKIIVVCLAERPPSTAVIQQLIGTGVRGLMLDTADKTTGNLLAKLSIEAIREFVRTVKSEHLLCGLAGSLKLDDIEQLLPLRSDYLGFRGALCTDSRTGTLSGQRVRAVKSAMAANARPVAAYATN